LVSRSEYYENDLGTRHLLNDLNSCKEQPLEETLLQKASIVTTPTAYDNGSLNSVKPIGGENLLLHSNQFDTTWSNSNTSESSGQIGYDGTNNAWLLSKSASKSRWCSYF
jgi:hypothetical protein